MSKDTYKTIDRKEKARIDELSKDFESDKPIDLADVYGSETIPKLLEDKPKLWVRSFRESDISLPLNCLLYSKILVSICPYCDCNKNPELIRPYLENEVTLPVLVAPLAEYTADFSDMILQYPYIGARTFNFLRFIQMMISDETRGALCPDCFDKQCRRILKKLSRTNRDRKVIDYFKAKLSDVVFPILTPTDYSECQILDTIETVVNQNSLELLPPLFGKSWILYNLRNSQLFEAIPQVSQNDLSNISRALREKFSSLSPEVIEHVKEKEWIVKALNIDYNPAMSVEDYLGIILPRRKKINSLVDEFISRGEKDQQLSKIEAEIWKINKEISSSKAIETLTFATTFISDNAKILFGMLIGGLIGYSSASFAGCGLGSLGGLVGGAAEKIISKHGTFSIPEYPKRTMEWIKEKVESPEQKLLSIILSKDIRVLQIWSLRKKLQKM